MKKLSLVVWTILEGHQSLFNHEFVVGGDFVLVEGWVAYRLAREMWAVTYWSTIIGSINDDGSNEEEQWRLQQWVVC